MPHFVIPLLSSHPASPRVAKFNNCESLTLYFDKNFGADETRIVYIGLKGDFTEVSILLQLLLVGKGCSIAVPIVASGEGGIT